MKLKLKNAFKAMAVAGVILVTTPQAHARTFLNMFSTSVGQPHGQVMVAFSQVVQRHLPVDIQVSSGQAAPIGMLEGAKHQYDVFFTAPSIIQMMKNRGAMFAKVEDAPELVKNIRNVLSYPGGLYQFVVYEDSGIRTMKDLKGKKLFLGPPAGASTATAIKVLEAATGYVPGKDYELSRYDWNTADTAFVDRQMDLFMLPGAYPSPAIQQYSMVSPIRLLDLPKEAFDHPNIKQILGADGRITGEIPANTYMKQANEASITALGTTVGIAVYKDLDEELVYNMTKTFWEHVEEVHATAEWMKGITLDNALAEMNAPLHAGAYRYYREIGVDIPEELVPPEVKSL